MTRRLQRLATVYLVAFILLVGITTDAYNQHHSVEMRRYNPPTFDPIQEA